MPRHSTPVRGLAGIELYYHMSDLTLQNADLSVKYVSRQRISDLAIDDPGARRNRLAPPSDSPLQTEPIHYSDEVRENAVSQTLRHDPRTCRNVEKDGALCVRELSSLVTGPDAVTVR